MAETFEPVNFLFETQYPESGTRLQLGNSWTFTAPPDAPDQRIFKLTLQGLRFYVEEDGTTIDTDTEPTRNAGRFDAFYQRHRLWKSFTFNHPQFGPLEVKFHKPLNLPKGIKGGNGLLPEFDIELVEQP